MPPKRDKDKEDNKVKFSVILDKLDALTKGKADSDGKLSQILIHTLELQTKIGDLGSDVTSLKSSLNFINTTVEELKSNIKNKVDKQVFKAYKKETAQKIDDLEKGLMITRQK